VQAWHNIMRAAVTVLTSYYLYRPPPRSSTFDPRAAKNCIAQLWERERERERERESFQAAKKL
jgi:hypothetical protein